METCPTKFVGRISLSAESLWKPFTIGMYGYLPSEVCSMETCTTEFVDSPFNPGCVFQPTLPNSTCNLTHNAVNYFHINNSLTENISPSLSRGEKSRKGVFVPRIPSSLYTFPNGVKVCMHPFLNPNPGLTLILKI